MSLNWTSRVQIPFTNMAEHAILTALDGDVQYVVWLDSPTGDYLEIRCAKKSLAKGKWNSARSLGVRNTLYPSFSIGANGKKLVAWESSLPIGETHRVAMLSFNRLSILGIPLPLGDGRWIPTSGDGISDFHPSVAISGDGVQHVTYSHGGRLYHAMWNGKSFVIEKVSNIESDSYFPSCAIDTSNPQTLLVAWEQTTSHKIYYALKKSDVMGWTPALELGEGSQVNLCAANGVVAAVWSGIESHQIQCRVWNGAWQPLEVPFALKSSYHPKVAIDGLGNLAITFMQFVAPIYLIYFASRVDGKWSKPTALPQQSNTFHDRSDIVIDAHGGLHTVYLEKSGEVKSAYSTDAV